MSYDFVTEWVLKTVREKYADDIALVVSHTTLRIDDSEKCISYFVPITKKGEAFAQTFILAGVGYDIWGISWERLERFAELEEYNITCLADGEVLYARTEEDRARFEGLKRKQTANLASDKKARACALTSYEEAKSIYLEMLFASDSRVKLGAGYVMDYLARAVAFSNHTYFRKSQTDQLNELQKMEDVPEGFAGLYRKILFERSEEQQKKGCYELIRLVGEYLTGKKAAGNDNTPREHHYQDLADWYGELSYTWLRIRHYTQIKDPVKVYMWGIYLQSELNQVCEDFGLEEIELMKYYDAENPGVMAAQADKAEQLIRKVIENGGGRIREFADEKEFLNEI